MKAGVRERKSKNKLKDRLKREKDRIETGRGTLRERER